MKKVTAIIVLLITAYFAGATILRPFTNWDDLVTNSQEIIIARCLAPRQMLTPKDIYKIGRIYESEIEVVTVLKGASKPGISRLTSMYRLDRGEYFLAFANSYHGYDAFEEYRIVSMGDRLQTNELAGKSLGDQVQLILTNRFTELSKEIDRANQEKSRLERTWNTNMPPEIFTNTPRSADGASF